MENIIEIHNLVKKFGNFTAVNNISFTVKKGEIFGFLGSNGAGKSTAMKIICGISVPTSGVVKVAGYDIYTQTDKIKSEIGYMSQKFALYNELTLIENLRLYGGIYGLTDKAIKDRSIFLLKKLDLWGKKDILVKDLPVGWKQKLAFSTSIIHNPKILFLDEPTGGVDPKARRQFWDLIKEAANESMTIFVTTHYMDEAEYCNRVSIMANGEIYALGTPADLKSEWQLNSIDEIFTKIARGI